jgi:hypothetical protein
LRLAWATQKDPASKGKEKEGEREGEGKKDTSKLTFLED